jgi:predicted MPP superfamily phosphohydrolase
MHIMKAYLFGIIFSALFTLLHVYIYKRFFTRLHLKESTLLISKYALYINFMFILLYFAARYYVDVPQWAYFILSLSIGVAFLLFVVALIYELLHFVMKISKAQKYKKEFDYAVLFFAFVLIVASTYNATKIYYDEVDVKIDGLKKEYKIVQLSDIHIGGLVDRYYIKNIVDMVNIQKPDIVVITGDIIDTKVSNVTDELHELQKLKARYGVYVVVGNHEYFHGVFEIIESLKKLGFIVLENESTYIGEDKSGFNLAGVYDMFGYRRGYLQPDLNKTLSYVKDSSPTILLSHQPAFINEVNSSVDLMLSGHTHGAQIYPFRALVRLKQPYINGLHEHNETQVYISNGTGFWGPPMRLGAPAQISIINIFG